MKYYNYKPKLTNKQEVKTKSKIILTVAEYTSLLIAVVFWVIACSMESQIPTGDQNLIKIQTYYIIPAILLTATYLGVIFRIYNTDVGLITMSCIALLAFLSKEAIPDIQQSKYRNTRNEINKLIAKYTFGSLPNPNNREDYNKINFERILEFKKIENIESLLITLNQKIENTDCNNIPLQELKALRHLNKDKDKFIYYSPAREVRLKPTLWEIKAARKVEKEKIKNVEKCKQIKAEIKTLNPQI